VTLLLKIGWRYRLNRCNVLELVTSIVAREGIMNVSERVIHFERGHTEFSVDL